MIPRCGSQLCMCSPIASYPLPTSMSCSIPILHNQHRRHREPQKLLWAHKSIPHHITRGHQTTNIVRRAIWNGLHYRKSQNSPRAIRLTGQRRQSLFLIHIISPWICQWLCVLVYILTISMCTIIRNQQTWTTYWGLFFDLGEGQSCSHNAQCLDVLFCNK